MEAGRDVRDLLDRGAGVNLSGRKKYGSALAAAAAKGDEEMFHTLIARGANVALQASEESKDGNALQAAIRHCHYDFAQELIERGVDIHAPGQCESSLIAASGFGTSTPQVELVKRLISLGANLETKDKLRGMALQQAAYANNEILAQILLHAGEQINTYGGEFGNPLQAAVVRNQLAMTNFLLSNRVNVNAIGGIWGTSP
jgi:ankyrin repeat protein